MSSCWCDDTNNNTLICVASKPLERLRRAPIQKSCSNSKSVNFPVIKGWIDNIIRYAMKLWSIGNVMKVHLKLRNLAIFSTDQTLERSTFQRTDATTK